MSSFAESALLPSLVASLAEQGLTELTEIQALTLDELLQGEPLVGVSETGSGKTLAYVLPMLHQLKSLELGGDQVTDEARPRGLVLVPGRELGEQVSRVFKGLTHGTRLRVRAVLGGTTMRVARRGVAGNFEILIASPGRLLQLLEAGHLRLDDVRMLVFDEADQVLDPGFLPVARRIVGACSAEVQPVLFSATLPEALESVVDGLFESEPLIVRTQGSEHLVPTLTVENREVDYGDRRSLLLEVLAEAHEAGCLLFANTRAQCEGIGEWLAEAGVGHAIYRGDMDRLERRANLAAFRAGELRVLITTDLGGRGLDIERVDRVINVYLPREVDNYLHRAGRTARAGREGLVINLVTDRDRPLLEVVARRLAPSA